MSIIEDVILKTKNAVQYVRTDKLKLHPNNPRFIKDRDFDILCESIQANPEFFEARPILCTPDMVVFAGNMRLRAARHLKQKTVPVIIMDITEEKARELMIRDNVQSGQWDTEALSGMFEMEELTAWGMPDFVFGSETDGATDNFQSDGPATPVNYSDRNREIDTDSFEDKCVLKLEYTMEDYEAVKTKLHQIAATPEQAVWQLLGL